MHQAAARTLPFPLAIVAGLFGCEAALLALVGIAAHEGAALWWIAAAADVLLAIGLFSGSERARMGAQALLLLGAAAAGWQLWLGVTGQGGGLVTPCAALLVRAWAFRVVASDAVRRYTDPPTLALTDQPPLRLRRRAAAPEPGAADTLPTGE
jgi:hypothetical protein